MQLPVTLPKRLLSGFNHETINRIIDYLRMITPMESRTVKPSYTTQGTSYRAIVPAESGGGEAIDTWTVLGYRMTSTNIVRIQKRYVNYADAGLVSTIEEQDVLLSGTDVFIYAECSRVAPFSAICPVRIAATFPTSSQTYINLVLYRFDLSYGVYNLGVPGWVNFNLASPVTY